MVRCLIKLTILMMYYSQMMRRYFACIYVDLGHGNKGREWREISAQDTLSTMYFLAYCGI